GPQAAITLKKQTVSISRNYSRNVAGHDLLGKVRVIVRTVTQLAISVVSHGPQAAVVLQKQAVEVASGNRCDVAGYNLLWNIDSRVRNAETPPPQPAITISAHTPEAAVTFKKQAE